MLSVVTPATSDALTVQSTAIRELALSEPETEGLAEMIATASAMVAAYCGRPRIGAHKPTFGRATLRQTERITTARACILLDDWLNPAITSITVDGVALADEDWELDGARLYRLSGDVRIWWRIGVVVVTYQTGYTLLDDLPHEVEQAALLTLGNLIAQRGADPNVRSESIAGVASVSYLDPRGGDGGLPQRAADMLGPFRRVYL